MNALKAVAFVSLAVSGLILGVLIVLSVAVQKTRGGVQRLETGL